MLIEKLDLLRRTAESARLYGIDFFSVLTRGSQYRVEAVMIRKAHALGYVAVSPSPIKVQRQAAMACMALTLEPVSLFYEDPVVVLDFQSLYPSIIIAYNLCYSTIIGKLNPGTTGGSDTTGCLGVSKYPEGVTAATVLQHRSYSTDPHIAPNGSIFCSQDMRHGILPQMLKEVVDARLLVKRSMKMYNKPEDEVLKRVMDAQQLAIKLLANVTCKFVFIFAFLS